MEQPARKIQSESARQDSVEGNEELLPKFLPEAAEKERLFYIEKLQSPYIKSFFTLIKDTPHFWDHLQKRNARREDFSHIAQDVYSQEDKFEIFDQAHIKRLVPLWSTACTVPELRAYLELALNAAAQEESARIKEKMEEAPQYVQEVVVGAGIHATAYNVEFMHYDPSTARLSVESSPNLGGQFRQYGGPAFRMNTPNRPINVDHPDVLDNPNMNSFGPHAPVQLSDVSGDLFADNEKIGIASAVNQFLSAKTVLDTTITKVRINTDKSLLGKYEVELVDTQTEKIKTITTDRLVMSTGLGKAEHGFSNFDEETERLCNAKDDRVITYTDFLKEVGDRSNQFPLERFVNKKVVIVGGGHSALTVAEYLVGIGPDYRGSTAALGYPCKIVIVGTRFDNEKKFIEGEIPRYAQLASAIKKEEVPGQEVAKDHLIKPMMGMRAVSLEEKKDVNEKGEGLKPSILVKCKAKTQSRGEGLDLVSVEEIEADIIITTTGFDNNGYKNIFSELISDDTQAPEFDDVYVEGVTHPVGRYLHGNKDIVFVGPAAGMPSSAKEISLAQKYNRPTNSVALPNTVDDTRACARFMVHSSDKKGNAEEFPGFGVRPEKKLLNIFNNGQSEKEKLVINISPEIATRQFSPEIHYDELLKLAVKGYTSKYVAESPTEVIINISREENINDDLFLAVSYPAGLSPDGESFVKDFFNDPMAQVAVAKLTERRHGVSKSLEIIFTV